MRRDLIGETLLNQFRVETYMASGGMATIYRVWDLQRSVPLAMKVLHPELADDPSFIARFEREAQSLQMLIHPHIVPFYGLYHADGLTFLLERYIDGPSLDEILRARSGQPVPLREALVYFKALYTSLGYAHAQGIIHCDVKPGNVLIDQGGHVYLTDFGIARYMDSLTMTSSAMGTPLYMAPEQIRGERVTPQTDVYSLGVLLFELLTGRRPFLGEDAIPEGVGSNPSDRVRYQQLYTPPPHPRALNPNIPEGVAQVVLRAMSKDPRERYPTTQAMADDLSRAVAARFDTLPDRVRFTDEQRHPPAETAWEGPPPEPEPYYRRDPAPVYPPGDTFSAAPSGPAASGAPYRPAASRRTPLIRWLALLGLLLVVTLCGLLSARIVRGLQGANPALPPATGETSTPSETAASDSTATVQPESTGTSSPPSPTASGLGDFAIEGVIAIVQRQGSDRLFLLNAADGSASELADLAGVSSELAQAPMWSPDGSKLAWMAQYSGRLHIIAMDMNDQQPYVITSGEAYPRVSSPSWLPTGQQVSFWAADGGQNWLVIADGVTGEESDRIALPGYRNLFVWSAQNGLVAFSQQRNGSYEVVVSSSADSAEVIIESGGEEYAPAWSKDGAWLAFQSDAGRNPGENEIWIARADGSEMRAVTSSPEGTWSRAPTWSPDGRMIAFVSNRSGSIGADFGELFVVDVASGQVRQLTSTGGRVYDWRPAWRP